MEFKNTKVFNFEGAFRGMRNPLNSWKMSDSYYDDGEYILGNKDIELAQKLIAGGSEHRKFLRQIFVSVDITAPVYWLAELDTYKVGTTRNSTSFMHKGVSKPFTIEDFEIDDGSYPEIWNQLIISLNKLRDIYLETKDYEVFRMIRQLLPMSYKYTSTITLNYEIVYNMYHQRKNHRLKEWSVDFVNWVKTLPYAEELIMLE